MLNTGPKFYKKNGQLTAYGLACGYIETFELDSENRVSLFREHNVYHIKGFIKGKHFAKSDFSLKVAWEWFALKRRQIKAK